MVQEVIGHSLVLVVVFPDYSYHYSVHILEISQKSSRPVVLLKIFGSHCRIQTSTLLVGIHSYLEEMQFFTCNKRFRSNHVSADEIFRNSLHTLCIPVD
jgi:hypothetical protein